MSNTTMIHVTVNGRSREIESHTSVQDFLNKNDIQQVFIAVAHNGSVLHKAEYSQVALEDGDSLEIVRMVGGG